AADLRAEKVDLVVREAGGELLPVVVQRRPSEDDATAGEVAQFPRHWIGLALPQDRVEEEARLAQTDAQRIDAETGMLAQPAADRLRLVLRQPAERAQSVEEALRTAERQCRIGLGQFAEPDFRPLPDRVPVGIAPRRLRQMLDRGTRQV